MAEERNKQQLMKKVNDFLIDYFRWVATVLLLSVLSIGAFFIVFPKYQEVYDQIEQSLTDQEAKRLAVSKYLTDLRLLKDSYSQVSQADRARIGRFLPSEPRAEELMFELDSLAGRLGATVTMLKVSEAGAGSGNAFAGLPGGTSTSSALVLSNDIKALTINMAVKNIDYNLFKGLLSAIEKNLRLVDIDKVSFNPGDGSASFQMAAYYLK